ncbi:MAG: hypothetical protein ACRCX5_14300 [Bacteroidales bacterium]
MKRFVYITKKSDKGNILKIRVYRIIRNKTVFVLDTETKIGMSTGCESVIMNELIEIGLIPKRFSKLSENSWRSKGFYCPEVEDAGVTITNLSF